MLRVKTWVRAEEDFASDLREQQLMAQQQQRGSAVRDEKLSVHRDRDKQEMENRDSAWKPGKPGNQGHVDDALDTSLVRISLVCEFVVGAFGGGTNSRAASPIGKRPVSLIASPNKSVQSLELRYEYMSRALSEQRIDEEESPRNDESVTAGELMHWSKLQGLVSTEDGTEGGPFVLDSAFEVLEAPEVSHINLTLTSNSLHTQQQRKKLLKNNSASPKSQRTNRQMVNPYPWSLNCPQDKEIIRYEEKKIEKTVKDRATRVYRDPTNMHRGVSESLEFHTGGRINTDNETDCEASLDTGDGMQLFAVQRELDLLEKNAHLSTLDRSYHGHSGRNDYDSSRLTESQSVSQSGRMPLSHHTHTHALQSSQRLCTSGNTPTKSHAHHCYQRN